MDISGQERLRHLEHLVAVMRRQLAERGVNSEDSPTPSKPPTAAKPPADPKIPETPGDLSGVTVPTPAGSLVGDLRFVDAANWEAILDDVSQTFGLSSIAVSMKTIMGKELLLTLHSHLRSPILPMN